MSEHVAEASFKTRGQTASVRAVKTAADGPRRPGDERRPLDRVAQQVGGCQNRYGNRTAPLTATTTANR